jgi:hypothetical protein
VLKRAGLMGLQAARIGGDLAGASTRFAVGMASRIPGMSGVMGRLGGVLPPSVRGLPTQPTGPTPVPTPVPSPEPNLDAPAPEDPPPPIFTEPKASSRDVAHAGGHDPDLDNWQDELDDGIDVITPAGTTGTGVGYNPDTAEAGLHEPELDDEPLIDPSVAKAVRKESQTLQRAADPNVGD